MNGRVYDYNLGRFMSVDPFIQAPTSTQSVNPYSYIMNNPLAGTDPTGYAACSSTGSHIKGQSGVFCSAIEYGSGGSGKKQTRSEATKVSNGAPLVQEELPANLQTSELNGQGQTAGKQDGNSTQYEGSFQEQIKQQVQDGIRSVGKDLGYASEGSVDARWRNVKEDEDGNLMSASVSCDTSCQKSAVDGHRLNVTRLDLQMYQMRTAYHSSQAEVARNSYKAVEFSSYPLLGFEVLAASAARWAFLKGSERLAYFGLIGEAASLVTGVDGSSAAVIQGAKTLIPRMRVGASAGKPRIRVDRNGEYVVE